MKSITPVILVVFAASAVMGRPIAKEFNQKDSIVEFGNVMDISEDEFRQKQLLCEIGFCTSNCPENCGL
ncbi:uncharacterized protein BYT42DRAFT_612413 [Radiomyces spectabilis]|uniref:uncharacterized protein n=1 Tax=Radiomyces spectabilis TaxID=64574 RepID=UPI00221E6441|nr:uncharacterized protein BYT42DRAFT_612413 [Radiomyces spectabilis]KAI8384734.1 hypothetical protein BYT42DRAFT_612413 [Radiomyces spectabilis]